MCKAYLKSHQLTWFQCFHCIVTLIILNRQEPYKCISIVRSLLQSCMLGSDSKACTACILGARHIVLLAASFHLDLPQHPQHPTLRWPPSQSKHFRRRKLHQPLYSLVLDIFKAIKSYTVKSNSVPIDASRFTGTQNHFFSLLQLVSIKIPIQISCTALPANFFTALHRNKPLHEPSPYQISIALV